MAIASTPGMVRSVTLEPADIAGCPEAVAARPGWQEIPAVRNGHLYEIKSPIILQPGPAALFDGLDALHRRIAEVARASGAGRA